MRWGLNVDVAALIPAKSLSRRVADKNFKPFADSLCLVERKILSLKAAGITRIRLSSDDPRAAIIAATYDVEFQSRPERLCGDVVNLQELFQFCLASWADKIVYWAHPTSPFITPETMLTALELACSQSHVCVLGVQKITDFLWTDQGPFNYDPRNQPRSQDLPALYRITGGVHIARGKQFCEEGAVSFLPARFVPLSAIESIDIDTQDDWDLAQRVALA
jgi:N-acylneuraminate cytidylyltransferase